MKYYWESLNDKEKYNLYIEAKDAYYNGIEKMDNIEFDALEKYLNLENKSYVGNVSSSYTIPHPVIMGSLSKVQIKEDEEGNVDWNFYWNEVMTYLSKAETSSYIATPKYDGCSFEVETKGKKIKHIASRGSKEKGKDIKPFLENIINDAILFNNLEGDWCFRGEILVRKEVFIDKYSSSFTNPRSFVSGIIAQKYNPNDEVQAEQIKDLSIVIYDVKYKNKKWIDKDWDICKDIINEKYLPSFCEYLNSFTNEDFENLYSDFNEYRYNCEYALDGIVIKPVVGTRPSTSDERPKDCIAVKFIPCLQETTIRDIEWSLSKNGELVPTIITDPVVMDNKNITHALASNYGKMVREHINIGAKVILSLAGDIIPYIYQVTEPSKNENYLSTVPYKDIEVKGCHLMKKLTEEEKMKILFISSCKSLEIKGMGDTICEKLFDGLEEKTDHILNIKYEDIINIIGGKTAENIVESFKYIVSNITLDKLILSCTFSGCGKKTSLECAKQIVNSNGNFNGLDYEAYKWSLEKYNDNMKKVKNLAHIIGKDLWEFTFENEEELIPVILTGSPSNYGTKNDFLIDNPQYKVTTSWNECKILFCGDLNSTSSKMTKAKKLGIEIKLY